MITKLASNAAFRATYFGTLLTVLTLLLTLGLGYAAADVTQNSTNEFESVILWFIVLLVISPAAYFAVRFLRRGRIMYLDPTKNPVLAGLTRHGDAWKIARELDEDLADRSRIVVLGTGLDSSTPDCVVLARNWVLQLYPSGAIRAVRLREAQWIYRKHTVNPSMTGSASYILKIVVRDHQGVEDFDIPRGSDLDEFLERIVKARPEIYTGFLAEYLDRWREGPEVMEAYLARRRKEYDMQDEVGRGQWRDQQMDDFDELIRRIDLG